MKAYCTSNNPKKISEHSEPSNNEKFRVEPMITLQIVGDSEGLVRGDIEWELAHDIMHQSVY